MRPSDAQMYSSLFFSGAPRRALLGLSGFSSPTVSSKCSVVPLCLSRISSNLISPWRLPHPPPAATTIAPVRFFSASDGVGVSAGEHLKRVIQAQIRRGEEELDAVRFLFLLSAFFCLFVVFCCRLFVSRCVWGLIFAWF